MVVEVLGLMKKTPYPNKAQLLMILQETLFEFATISTIAFPMDIIISRQVAGLLLVQGLEVGCQVFV